MGHVGKEWGLRPRVRGAVTQLLRHHDEVKITSGRRNWAHNRAVGGARTSRHLTGHAVDIVGPAHVLDHLRERARAYGAIEVLDEGDHTHLGWPRNW